jgi:hypothetical protein
MNNQLIRYNKDANNYFPMYRSLKFKDDPSPIMSFASSISFFSIVAVHPFTFSHFWDNPLVTDELPILSYISDDFSDIKNIIKKIKEMNIPSRSIDIQSCNICLENKTDMVITPCCQQSFCEDCLVQSINIKNCCPICRQEFDLKN